MCLEYIDIQSERLHGWLLSSSLFICVEMELNKVLDFIQPSKMYTYDNTTDLFFLVHGGIKKRKKKNN
jgi:hypothetical protein